MEMSLPLGPSDEIKRKAKPPTVNGLNTKYAVCLEIFGS